MKLAVFLRKAMAGAPFERSPLRRSMFVEVPVVRVPDARVLWVNHALFRDRHVELPTDARELNATLIRALAWKVTEGRPDAVFHADRYGTSNVHPNLGSGRAAAKGLLQFKGIGRTALVHAAADSMHRDGLLSLGDAMREALWGEVNHRDLPFGANRVWVVLALTAQRALVVRELPIRPAHFMPQLNGPQPKDFARQVAAIGDALPRGQLGAFLRRLGRQHAAMAVRRIPHGALNASNLELSGRVLDYGTQSSQPGHGETTISPPQYGPLRLHDVVSAFLDAVLPSLGTGSRSRWLARFEVWHGRAIVDALVQLTGVPRAVEQAVARSPVVDELGFALARVAFASTRRRIAIYRRAPRWTGTYDAGRLLLALACVRRQSRSKQRAAFGSLVGDPAVHALIEAYAAYRDEIDAVARARGFSLTSWDELVVRACAFRNEDRPALALTRLTKRYRALSRAEDLAAMGQAIDDDVRDNSRFFDDEPERPDVLLRRWDAPSRFEARLLHDQQRGYRLSVTGFGPVRVFRGSQLLEPSSVGPSGAEWLVDAAWRSLRIDDLTLALVPPHVLRGVRQVRRHHRLPRPVVCPPEWR